METWNLYSLIMQESVWKDEIRDFNVFILPTYKSKSCLCSIYPSFFFSAHRKKAYHAFERGERVTENGDNGNADQGLSQYLRRLPTD